MLNMFIKKQEPQAIFKIDNTLRDKRIEKMKERRRKRDQKFRATILAFD